MPTAVMTRGTIIGEIRIPMMVVLKGNSGVAQTHRRHRAEEGRQNGGEECDDATVLDRELPHIRLFTDEEVMYQRRLNPGIG